MPHVLVVEDHADTCDAIARALRKAGYRATCAANGQEALYAIGRERPDVIVADLLMPVMDGLSFLRVLRSYLRWHELPVVVVTAVPDGPELDMVRQQRVRRIFRKAEYQLPDLVAAVEQIAPPPPRA